MRKTVPFIKAAAVSAALLAACAAVSGSSSGNQTPPVSESSTGVILYSEGESYTLREFNGRLAVFRGSEDEPSEVFDIFVQSLPDDDRAALAEGITVSSPEELRKLLEDYTG